jgi:hypothetical protein
MMLSGERVPFVQIVQEAIDLFDAVMVHVGEVRFEADSDSMKRLRPEHHAAENQEWRSNGTGEQDSADAGDNQQNSDLGGHVANLADLLEVFRSQFGCWYLALALTRHARLLRTVHLKSSPHAISGTGITSPGGNSSLNLLMLPD